MLDRRWVTENLDEVANLLQRRNTDLDLQPLEEAERERRQLTTEVEALRHQRKVTSEQIGQKKRAGEDTSEIQAEVRVLGEQIHALEVRQQAAQEAADEILLWVPNRLAEDVPTGHDENDNRVESTWGEPLANEGWRLPHWDVGERLGILDFERAAKLSGSRFVVMRGLGARLEKTLVSWMMDMHAEQGYEEVIPPYLVRPEMMQGTGQLPKFAEDSFHVEKEDLYMIPTAEVPVTNMYRDEILDNEELPKKFVAFSPCFRAEAGAAGKDTRGMVRVHQFHKVELVHIERPEDSQAGLEALRQQAEQILQALGLTYRVSVLCSGDTGFAAAKTYDLEVWLPGQERWLEISSCSTFGDFQARRSKIRYRSERGAKPQFVHTLNGSALAIGRTIVAILENYQNQDGSVTVPEVLRDQLRTDKIVGTQTS